MTDWNAALTPGGHAVSYRVRTDANDAALVNGILGEDEYRLKDLPPLTGWALDIGAHVGTVALALAMDHPSLNVIAIEAVPENAALIQETIYHAGVADRVHVLAEAAGPVGKATLPCRYGYTKIGDVDERYVEQNRFIGNIWRLSDAADGIEVQAPVVTIADLRERFGVDRFAFAKSDCEGCEWDFFAEGAEYIDIITGEWHDQPFSSVEKLLGKTHNIERLTSYDGGMGIFRATIK